MGILRQRLLQIIATKKERGLTQAELARRMKCVPSQINHLLTGERKLNEDWIIKLCDALGVSLSDLDWQKTEVTPQEHEELYRKLHYILTKTRRSEKVLRAAIDAAFEEVSDGERKVR